MELTALSPSSHDYTADPLLPKAQMDGHAYIICYGALATTNSRVEYISQLNAELSEAEKQFDCFKIAALTVALKELSPEQTPSRTSTIQRNRPTAQIQTLMPHMPR